MNNSFVVDRQKGFTLIEVVIALAITAVIASFTYTSFSTASRSVETGREVVEGVNRLDRAWQILAQDLRHILSPETVTVYGETRIKKTFRGASLNDGDAAGLQLLLQLSRHGWLNPMNRVRSDLQQVIYKVEDGVLWRDYRPERNVVDDDGIYSEDLLHQLLIENVTNIRLRFLSKPLAANQGAGVLNGDDFARDWDEVWPPVTGNDLTTLPVAMLITIELEDGTSSERLYAVAP